MRAMANMFSLCLRSAALAAAALIVGCSGVKTYPDQTSRNLQVRTQVDTGSIMKSTVVEFDVHLVDANCESSYLGRVYLDRPTIETGIPTNRQVYLDFIFASNMRLSSNISAIRHGILFTPRADHDYDAKVSYDKGLYEVVLRESRNGKTTRLIPRKSLRECQPGK